jgi:amidophosphoribosyltransferase
MRKGCGLDGFDSSCFDGKYITGDIDSKYLEKLRAARNDASKVEESMDDERSIDMHNHQI